MYFNNKFNKIRTIIFSMLYIVCLILQTMISMGKIPEVTKNFFSINGCIGALSICVMILNIITTNGRSFKVNVTIQLLNIFYMVVTMVRFRFFMPMPSLILTIINLFTSTILYKYLKKIQSNELELDKLSYTDISTGILNKKGLIKELRIKHNLGKEFYLALIGLEDIKRINDISNLEEGEKIIIALVNKWSEMNDKFVLARMGNNTFAMIVDDTSKDKMDKIMDNVIETTSIISKDYNVLINLFIGISHCTKDTSNIDLLITYAEITMNALKNKNKNAYEYFDADEYKKITKRYLTEKDIRVALENDSFEVVYQPQFDLKSHKLVGFESLIRMYDKKGNFVNTQEFILVAESSGLIYELDLWIIKNVLIQTSRYVKEHPAIEISINISGKHFIVPGFIDYIIKCLEFYNFNPKNLKIEITESSYIKDFDKTISVINELRSLGIKIALDDFGTGYSSLSYLTKIPTDLIKIDKSFIDEMEINEEKCSFVNMIINLGHFMRNKVIAEGVENKEQLDLLNKLKCDYIQGYVWGKPMFLKDIESIKD